VPPADRAAFLGEIAPALSTITASGQEWAFAFSGHASTEGGGYAQLGQSRNGVFL
jgi:hypothetical protein